MTTKQATKEWIDLNLESYKKENGTYVFSKAALMNLLIIFPKPTGMFDNFLNINQAREIVRLRDRQDFQYIRIAEIIKQRHPRLLHGIEPSELVGVQLIERARSIFIAVKQDSVV